MALDKFGCSCDGQEIICGDQLVKNENQDLCYNRQIREEWLSQIENSEDCDSMVDLVVDYYDTQIKLKTRLDRYEKVLWMINAWAISGNQNLID